jgi:ATP-dependent Clp protease ATP-binding subunit ClpX
MGELRAVDEPRGDARCSFCGKKADEVEVLIQNLGAFICDECVEMCTEIVARHREQG